jgi:hypothetical protein
MLSGHPGVRNVGCSIPDEKWCTENGRRKVVDEDEWWKKNSGREIAGEEQ